MENGIARTSRDSAIDGRVTESLLGVGMLTGGQIRAARGLIGWTQRQLANASGVSEISIKNIEGGKTDAKASTLTAIRDAFEAAGVVFLDAGDTRTGGPGVRLKSTRRR